MKSLDRKASIYIKTEEKKENDETYVSKFIVSEENKYKQVWDLFIMVLVLYIAVLVPYRLAFQQDDDKT